MTGQFPRAPRPFNAEEVATMPRDLANYVKMRVHTTYGDRHLSLNTIASEVKVSRAHLSRTFARLHGRGFREYLCRMRVRHAICRLRSQPFTSIKEVALDCGFTDTTAMDRAFRRTIGVLPSAVRGVAATRRSLLREDV